MKKILIPTLILASISFTNLYANETTNQYKNFSDIYINNEKNNKLDVITYHNTNFINAGVLSREIGLNVEWKSPTVTITDNKNNVVKVNVGDVNIRKNDKIHLMYDAPFIKNDRIYVPLRMTCEIFGYTVDFDVLDKIIKIDTNSKDMTISSDKLEYDLSPNKRFGIAYITSNYISEKESPYPAVYSKTFLKDFKTGIHYKFDDSVLKTKYIWTNDNKLILLKRIHQGFYSDGETVNKLPYRNEVSIIEPENMKFIDTKLKIKTSKYDKNTNIFYYSSDYKKYIAYNLNDYSKKEITKEQFEQIKTSQAGHTLP